MRAREVNQRPVHCRRSGPSFYACESSLGPPSITSGLSIRFIVMIQDLLARHRELHQSLGFLDAPRRKGYKDRSRMQ